MHKKQALVLINTGGATGYEIASLAKFVCQKVADKFAIWLEPEVRFIAARGEVSIVILKVCPSVAANLTYLFLYT